MMESVSKERTRLAFAAPRLGLAAGLVACVGIALYALWYSSVGQFPRFPNVENAYIDLGESFLHGQLYLAEQPDPRLAELQNPYDYQQRKNMLQHKDASYYQGRYYLYWGPIPALDLALIEGVTHLRPPGSLMVVMSYIGLSIILLLILLQVWRRFFPAAPFLSVGLWIAMCLVNLPFLYLLGRPQIYETSIIAGQFFLFAGLFCWIMYTGSGLPAWLLMAGLSWGFAIGCRYNLIASVAVYAAFALLHIWKVAKWNSIWKRAVFLLVPLVLTGIGLGAYNFARFGNLFETGFAYALTVPVPPKIFSFIYLPSNVYTYLFYAPNTIGSFPFIKSVLFNPALLPPWLGIPAGKTFDEVIFGIFAFVPSVWLITLVIPIFGLVRTPTGRRRSFFFARSERGALIGMILFAAFLQFLVIMMYFYSAMRFVADFYLPVALGIAMIVWRVDEILQRRFWVRAAFWLLVFGLILWTAGIGFFGAFDVPPQIFRTFNPALYVHLASYWNNVLGSN
jgi:hypothetical protein